MFKGKKPYVVARKFNLPKKECLNILHISDIHFNKHVGSDDKEMLDEIIRHVEQSRGISENIIDERNEESLQLDICIIAGDVSYNGNGMFDEGEKRRTKAKLKDFFHRVIGSQDYHKRVVMVPGNHDVPYMRKNSNGEDTGRDISRFVSFRNELYCEKVSSIERKDLGNFCSCISYYTCKNFNVLICGFDSTLLVGTKNPRKEYYSEGLGKISVEQMEAVEGELNKIDFKGKPTFKIAVLHHHLLPMKDVEMLDSGDIDPDSFTFTVDSIRFRDWLREKKFDIVLHGHQHLTYLAEEAQHLYKGWSCGTEQSRRLVYAGSAAAGYSDKGNRGYNTISFRPDFFDISLYSQSGARHKKKRFYSRNIDAYRKQIVEEVKSIGNHFDKDIKSDYREELDFKSYRDYELKLPIAEQEYEKCLVYLFLEALGIWQIKEEDEIYKGISKWPAGDRTLKGICKCLSLSLAKTRSMLSHRNDKIREPAVDRFSLLNMTRHMTSELIKRGDLDSQDIESKDYTFACIAKLSATNDWQILLSKHTTWPMYILPSFNKEKEKKRPESSPCLVERCHRDKFPKASSIDAIFSCSKKGTKTPCEDGFCGCATGFSIKNIFAYPSPSGSGPAKHKIHIKLCIPDDADNVTQVFQETPGDPEKWFRWFTLNQLENYEHITSVLKDSPYFEEQAKNLLERSPGRINELLGGNYNNEGLLSELLLEIFAREIYGPRGTEGKFSDNLDVINVIFKRLDSKGS